MMYPLVRELAVDGVPVTVTCRVLGFSRQAFYAWDANPVSDRDWDDAHLVNAILDVHGDDPEFGYRFIADELAADPSVVDASENRIWRLCRQNGVASVITKRKGSGKTPGPAVQPPPLGHPRPTAPGHRVLDRAHLPPPAPPAGPRQADPCRV
jgi:putative transposase